MRKIIKIDADKCNGCGLCVPACHEGAIGMRDGAAVLLRDDYCDGLGDCLPVCPTGAITFETREALPYNEAEVMKNLEEAKNPEQTKAAKQAGTPDLPCGCPGTQSKSIVRGGDNYPQQGSGPIRTLLSQLRQWPIQIKLVPTSAPYFQGADLLVAADCAAYAHGNFHEMFIKGRITLIGCPKLDTGDYSEKLTAIIKSNDIKSLTVARMHVPCCGGLETAAKTALADSGKSLPLQVMVISTDGDIVGFGG